MTTAIDKVKTGQQIRLLMEKRGITVRDVKTALSLGCVQSVYHWLDGQSMPTLDNLYALSELLKVPMEAISRKGNLISCDVFSTRSTGEPIGTQEFAVIDTATWKFQGVR